MQVSRAYGGRVERPGSVAAVQLATAVQFVMLAGATLIAFVVAMLLRPGTSAWLRGSVR